MMAYILLLYNFALGVSVNDMLQILNIAFSILADNLDVLVRLQFQFLNIAIVMGMWVGVGDLVL